MLVERQPEEKKKEEGKERRETKQVPRAGTPSTNLQSVKKNQHQGEEQRSDGSLRVCSRGSLKRTKEHCPQRVRARSMNSQADGSHLWNLGQVSFSSLFSLLQSVHDNGEHCRHCNCMAQEIKEDICFANCGIFPVPGSCLTYN